MRRRELLFFLSAVFARNAAGFPITRILGPATPPYIRGYFDRMWSWYNQEFAPLAQEMQAGEKELLQLWLSELSAWGIPISENQIFEHFLFSHRIDGKTIDHKRFAFGSEHWSPAGREKLNQVIKKRGLAVPKEMPYGVGWNLARQEFKIYFYHKTADIAGDAELAKWSKEHSAPTWLATRLSCFTYQNAKLVKKKLIVPMRELNWTEIGTPPSLDAISAMKLIESSGVRWHYHLHSLLPITVAPIGHTTFGKHVKTFQQVAQSIVFENRDRYTMYYP